MQLQAVTSSIASHGRRPKVFSQGNDSQPARVTYCTPVADVTTPKYARRLLWGIIITDLLAVFGKPGAAFENNFPFLLSNNLNQAVSDDSSAIAVTSKIG
jgi:hypothetical protein